MDIETLVLLTFTEVIVEDCKEWMNRTDAYVLLKNYRVSAFKELSGILCHCTHSHLVRDLHNAVVGTSTFPLISRDILGVTPNTFTSTFSKGVRLFILLDPVRV